MSHYDAHKQYECSTKRNAGNLHLAEKEAERNYHAQQENGMGYALSKQQIVKPTHFVS
jgi:hypothetical protein